MSGKRTKALRRECAKRLNRAPRRADGHVTIKTATANVGGILRRVIAFMKPKEHVQHDEFRFFKRHGQTSIEASVARAAFLAARERHDREVTENNELLAMLLAARGEAA